MISIISSVLFVIFPLLFLFSYNIEQASISQIMIPLVAALVGMSIVLAVSFFAFKRNVHKAAIFTAFFSFLFFSYGHLRNLIEGATIVGFDIGRDRYVLLGSCLVLLITFIGFFRSQKKFEKGTKFIFKFAIVLTIIPLFSIIRFELFTADNNTRSVQDGILSGRSSTTDGTLPDIYYIILDGYAHESTLRAIYKFDNTTFLKDLGERGFFIPAASRANYAQTHLSLASSLSMDYLPIFPKDSNDRSLTFQLIKKNAVSGFLRSRGYRFIQVSSGMVEMTNRNPYADLDFRNGRFDEFTIIALESSAAYPFVRSYVEAEERERVLYSFEALTKMPALAGPKFVFAHILVPHPPFVFGPNGERIDDPSLRIYENNPWVLKRHYIDQLKFTNQKTLDIVDSIIAHSSKPPIIILQADHGTASTGTGYKGLENPSELLAKERMKIFAAYRLPGHENIIPDEITPVNAFRKIFNTYFGANFLELPNKSYFSHYERPYDLIDVTENARKSY